PYTVNPLYDLPENFAPSLPEGRSADDFVITFAVIFLDNPAFFLEIEPPGDVNDISARIAADNQMRERFRSLDQITTVPRLHGISIMGQMLAFYYMDKSSGCVVPGLPTAEGEDSIPINRWDLDITTEAGHRGLWRS
ncbi:uncharacterized protein EDB91DRAFT_1059064, partial [Suillus paluster]|uniref:uncharacterized protein n=1 Tax=Suillus paluster TaxID=48578 RepID=UPI001B87F3DD